MWLLAPVGMDARPWLHVKLKKTLEMVSALSNARRKQLFLQRVTVARRRQCKIIILRAFLLVFA